MKNGLRRGLSLLLLLCLLCAGWVSPALGAEFHPSGEAEADRQARALFFHCAFHPEYFGTGRLNRWVREITVWTGGAPTTEDRQALDSFLEELRERVPGLPPIRRVREDRQAAVRIWFVPSFLMGAYVDGYVDGNEGFFRYDYDASGVITSARICIAADSTEQEERNHLILEELVGALGLPGDHEVYSDSILYERWTTVQELSDVDWRMLNLLYSPALEPGMTEQQARDALTGYSADPS